MTLHHDALVVRGGTVRDPATLIQKVDEAIADGDGPVISVFCDVSRTENSTGRNLHELCADSEVVHSQVQVSTFGRLAAHFQLVQDVSDEQPETHHNVILTEPVQESEIWAFISCFDDPIPNPAGGKRRSR